MKTTFQIEQNVGGTWIKGFEFASEERARDEIKGSEKGYRIVKIVRSRGKIITQIVIGA